MSNLSSSPASEPTGIRTSRWSILRGSAGMILLMVLAGSWLVASNQGARFCLSLLEHFTGIECQGVSGSLVQHLHIQHLTLKEKQLGLVADELDLQWQPAKLLDRHIQLNWLTVGSVQLALAPGNGQPSVAPRTLRLPAIIRLLQADRVSIAQFQLETLNSDHVHNNAQHFSDLRASLTIDADKIAMQIQGATPWGNAALNGSLGNSAPFTVDGNIRWQGLPVDQGKITLPEANLLGTLAGNLSAIQLQAQVVAQSGAVGPDLPSGTIAAVLTPFAPLPVDTLQFDLVSINPASFYQGAPRARLNLKAGFTVHGVIDAPTLSGRFSMINQIPVPWNLGGLPIGQISSDLILSEHEIRWKNSRIDLGKGGAAQGHGGLILHPASGNLARVLPDIAGQFKLTRVDLAVLDSRVKKTALDGTAALSRLDKALHLELNLHETNPARQAQLRAEINLDENLKLDVLQMELKASQAMVAARGSITLDNKQDFKLSGEMQNFNPSRWLAVPDGQIALKFNLAGRFKQGQLGQVDAQVSGLNGKFAGLDLHGESDFQFGPNDMLSIQKLNFDWGKNHLAAHGNWQVGTHLNAKQHEELHLSVALPDLEKLSRPFENFLPAPMQGAVYADGTLTGNAIRPSGRLTVQVSKFAFPGRFYLDHLQADLAMEEGLQGKFSGQVDAGGLGSAIMDKVSTHGGDWQVLALKAEITGVRHDHTVHLTASLPQEQQFSLQAKGNLQEQVSEQHGPIWKGQIVSMNLSGALDFQLLAPFVLNLSTQTAQMSEANWQGSLGRLHVAQLNWANGQLETSGQFQAIPLVRLLKFWRADLPVAGDLQVDMDWHTQIGPQLLGQIQLRRTKGDLMVQDLSGGHGAPSGMGLTTLMVTASLPDGDHGRIQPAELHLQVHGDRLGQIDADVSGSLAKNGQQWQVQQDAPLSGRATVQINDIHWMSQMVGEGISLNGVLNARAELRGSLGVPDYSAAISGHDLQIGLTELGVLLPNGQLDAVIEDNQLKLNSLTFSDAIKKPPNHEKLLDLGWLSETGQLEANGSIDLRTRQGAISTRWNKFPFMQSSVGWLVASGQAQLVQTSKIWNLTGNLRADAAYFSVPKQAAPKLSSDVLVLSKNEMRNHNKSSGVPSMLDFSIATGDKFIFVGRGINTRLNGEIRIRSKNGGPFIATGNIQTAGGTYEGYGQKLDIDRGILNFQGPLDNPGLNVRAIRRGLAVEAGVELIGTVDKPEVHLVSEPNVPDPDKLSWMVLGRAPDQMAGSEASLLMSAAGAIFGGDAGSKIPGSITRTFGLEGLSFGTTTTSAGTQLPAQTVAGTINSAAPGDQAFSVGKRIAPGLVFSIERSLTDASNGMKLTWKLTRRFSIIGRAGSDNAVDGQYLFSFD